MFINLPTNHIEAIVTVTDISKSFTIRYDTRCYINVRSKANMSQLNLPHAVLPTRWRRKLADIDMEKNYVTVILCIAVC